MTPGCVDELLKGRTVFAIPVMDQVLPRREKAPLLHRDVAGNLHHPGLRRMRRHPRNMDLSAAQMDEEEHVIRHESTECPHLGRKEISGHKDVHVGADKLLPRRGRLALGSRRDAMALEDVPYGLGR